MSNWHLQTLCGLDFESTGVDIESDRIVTCCVARIDGSGRQRPAAKRWLVAPGIPVPAEATKIHGVTDEQARREGQDPAEAICEIADMLYRALDKGVPIVGYNISYDLSLLDRELRRHRLPPLPANLSPVIDGLVLDKHVDTYRKGSRKLVDVAKHYNVALDDAHEASADAWAAAGVACRIGAKYPAVGRLTLDELHALQIEAKKEQDLGFARYLRSKGELDKADTITGDWPVIPFERQEAIA